jgi:hypothetical protein
MYTPQRKANAYLAAYRTLAKRNRRVSIQQPLFAAEPSACAS